MTRRTSAATLVIVLLSVGCSSAVTAPETTVATTTIVTTTTAPPTTTTTLPPLATATVTAPDADLALLDLMAQTYSRAIDTRNPEPDGSPGLGTYLTGLDPRAGDITVAGTVTAEEIIEGQWVAVFTAGDDIVLASRSGEEQWRVAGAKLASLGGDAWYGDSPRMLLILGSDARPGQNQQRYRADSIHIVTTSGPDGSIVGIPRDSWVEGPEGSSKLTNVMAGRGPEVMLETVREVSGLPLEGYIVTGFAGFTALVDDFGGLTIDLPYQVRTGVDSWPTFAKGLQALTGERALQLAVIRKTLPAGDFDRSFNHGLIMMAALDQVRAMDIHQLPALLTILLEHTWTDLPADALISLGAAAYELDPEHVINTVLPGTVGNVGSASVVFLGDDAFEVLTDLEDGLLAADG